MKHTGINIILLLLLASVLGYGCQNDIPPTAKEVTNRDSLPIMTTIGVSKLISDSGVIKYKIVAEQWTYYDMTKPPRQEFLKGIFLERLDSKFQPDLFISADTAYCYNQNLWLLRGRVVFNNKAEGTVLHTEELYWDMGIHELYSRKYFVLTRPEDHVEGTGFRTDEGLTRYFITDARGYMPMPQDEAEEDEPADETAKQD